MHIRISCLLFCCLIINLLTAQLHYSIENEFIEHNAHRALLQGDTFLNIHAGFQPFLLSDVYALNVSTNKNKSSETQFNDAYLKKELGLMNLDSSQQQSGWLNTFYKNPGHFFEVNEKDFSLTIDPIFNFRIGKDNDQTIYQNTRGFNLQGAWDQKFFFYTAFYENQGNFLSFVNDFIDQYSTIPTQGNYKPFGGAFGLPEGYDFSNARGYLAYQTSKHSYLELGHGRHFVGHGMRSLLLSDFAQNYFYFKFNLNIWKIRYQTIFAEMQAHATRQTQGDQLLSKKYMAQHTLSYKPSNNFEIALFESVIFSRENHFEFQYLNPFILYRTVEHLLDSPDNVLLGLNLQWRIRKNLALYGQFIFDELRTSEIFAGNGWWGNKHGVQAGIKSFDIFNIKFLDAQIEWNYVRPYTYSHNIPSSDFPDLTVTSYSQFNQPLAHPLGANFTEIIFKLRYQCFKKLIIESRYFYTRVGKDTQNNVGQDILLNNNTRVSNLGITHLQGNINTIHNFDINLSYMLVHDMFLDINFLKRQQTQVSPIHENTFWSLGLRYNINNLKIDY